MLDRKPEPPWTRWAQHQPVGISRKVFIGKRLAEHLVIDPEILHGHATLRYSGRAAGFVIKMPLDDIPHMCIQPCVGILYSGGKSDFGCRRPHSLHSRSAMAMVVLQALVLQPSI